MKPLTEKQAAEQFVSSVPKKYFMIHSQCRGEAIYVKRLKKIFACWDEKAVPNYGLIDFILEPTNRLLEKGWEIGCVGVEIKSSFQIDKKPGKAIVQILDYQSCKYQLNGRETELSMIFLFPFRETANDIASIMQQEGLGFVRCKLNYGIEFQLLQANTSHEPVFTSYNDGRMSIRRPRYGKKFGHR
jgi:hypothetical protein